VADPAPVVAESVAPTASPVVGLDLGAAPDPSTRVIPEEAPKIDAEAAFNNAIAQDEAPVDVVAAEPAAAVLDPGSTTEFPPVGLVGEDIEAEATAAVEEINAAQLAVASTELPSVEEPASYVAEETVAEEEPVEKGISVITREATVLGDIITEGHIDIVGRVKGNIDAKGDVAIHGIVRGDVGGEKIGLYSCRVKGNLDAGLGVIVDESSIIGGDVKTKNIIFDGKVKGNIDADNIVVLRSHSYCLGDVSATSLAVEPGAILNGKVRTFVKGDLEAPFDEVM
jgi:cytoskeletal protein CcmA (bactofilin family)